MEYGMTRPEGFKDSRQQIVAEEETKYQEYSCIDLNENWPWNEHELVFFSVPRLVPHRQETELLERIWEARIRKAPADHREDPSRKNYSFKAACGTLPKEH